MKRLEHYLVGDDEVYDRMYLIDTENVGSKWLSLLDELEERHIIILCYTDMSGKYGLDDVQTLFEHKDALRFVKCFNGHANALDFQLSALVGYLYHVHRETEFVIVSNDMGYCSVVDYMIGMGAKISQLRLNQSHVPTVTKSQNMFPEDELMTIFQLGKQDIGLIAAMLNDTYESHDSFAMKSRDVNNWLQQEYGADGQAYYKLLRDNHILDRLM